MNPKNLVNNDVAVPTDDDLVFLSVNGIKVLLQRDQGFGKRVVGFIGTTP